MTFKIEFSDERFRLVIGLPNGEEDYLDAVHSFKAPEKADTSYGRMP